MSLAVFLIPSGSFNDEIIHWKRKINKFFSNSPYNNHPPHSTIINLEIVNENEAINTIKRISTGLKSFEITIDHTNVFWNDGATGGHTLYFGINKNDRLFSLQQLLADWR